jgi:hypothetical protein
VFEKGGNVTDQPGNETLAQISLASTHVTTLCIRFSSLVNCFIHTVTLRKMYRKCLNHET